MWLLWYILHPIIIVVHSGIVIGNLFVLVILPFYTPWYVWLPLCTLVVRMITDPNPCIATKLENSLRSKIGKRSIPGFVSNYTTSHLVSLWRKIRGKI